MKRPARARFLVGLLIVACGMGGCSSRGAFAQIKKALESGRNQDAYRLAVAAAEEHPESSAAHVLLAEAAYRTLRTSPGVEAAARAVELDSTDARAQMIKGLLDQRRFRNVAAVAAAEEATRLAPEEALYHVALGELRLGGGMVGTADYDGAESAFREALRLDPDNVRARFGLGKTLVLAGDHEAGENELNVVFAERPGFGEVHYLRGVSRMRRRDHAGAAADFQEAIRLTPELAPPYFNLARVLERQGKTRRAQAVRERYPVIRSLGERIRQAEVAFHSASRNVGSGLSLAKLLADAGRKEDAYALLESLCLDHPGHAAAHLFRAELAIATKRLEPADEATRRATELAPENPRALHAAALLKSERGEWEGAVELARNAARLAPNEIEFQLTLGRLLLAAEDFNEAARVFQGVANRNPRLPAAAAGLGRALVAAGRAAEGEAALSNALQARPQQAEWLHARGLARVVLGKAGWAEEDFRAAIAVDPNHAPSYRQLADLCLEAGRVDEADEASERHREVSHLEREIREARETLHRTPGSQGAALGLANLLRKAGLDHEAGRLQSATAAWNLLP